MVRWIRMTLRPGPSQTWRALGDEHRRLADLQAADAMQHRHALDAGPARADGGADLAHLGLGHRRVRLVLEELHGPAAGLVPDHAGEDHQATGAGIVDARGDVVGRERAIDDREDIRRARAPADRRK